jgi:large exoprotein involved in heme utilization and adhesion
VTILADTISLNGSGTGIFGVVGFRGTGRGGDINITTQTLSLSNGAEIGSGVFSTGGTGIGGNINIAAKSVFLDNGSAIVSKTVSGDGGNIFLNISDLLLLRRGSQISTTAGTSQRGGDGGNITIAAPNGFIVGVKSENSDITANAFTGSGGRVNITAQGIFGLEFRPQVTELSDITASSTFGQSGVVTLNLPNVDPSRGLVQLPQGVIDTNRILANSCIVRDRATGGVFLVTGKGGLPVRPGDLPLPAFSLGEVQGVERAEAQEREAASRGLASQPPRGQHGNGEPSKIEYEGPIVEAQGVYRLPDGQLILSWECGR